MLNDAEAARTRVLVIDDHPVVVRGVRTMLERDQSMLLVGDANDAGDGIRKALELRADLVLLDLRLPGADLVETVDALRTAAPDAKIVVFTAYSNAAAVARAADAKVDGFLLKDASEGDMVKLLHRVASGESVFQPWQYERSSPQVAPLTQREIQVLRQVAMGRTNAEVAQELLLAPNTVKSYLQSAMRKLGAHNRVEALHRSSELGIL